MENKSEIIEDSIFNDYNALIVAYQDACNNTKTSAEYTLLNITFGAYIANLNKTNSIDINKFFIQLNDIYTEYYTIYLSNIKKCNIDNFNKMRNIVCMLLDKYGPSHSESKQYYLPFTQYLYECKYG